MLTPKDIRNAFIANPRLLDWILFENYVFADDIDTPEKAAMHKWGMRLLKMIGPQKDNMNKVEWLKRAIHCEED